MKMEFEAQKCTGCMACIFSCSVKKHDMFAYHLAHLRMQRDEAIALSDLRFCGNCSTHACLEACPVQAISYSEAYHIPVLAQDDCIACGACLDACPAGLVKENAAGAICKCDFCAGDPACVKACIPQALTVTAEEEAAGGAK